MKFLTSSHVAGDIPRLGAMELTHEPCGIESSMTTVLVVDDDCDIREGLCGALAREGYAVCEAVDGEEALALLTSGQVRPHIVLLDMMMPRMNGDELLAELAQRREFDTLPVVVISTYRTETQTGVRAFIEKPVDLDALLTVVAKLCTDAADAA